MPVAALLDERFAALLRGGPDDPNPLYAEARASSPIFWSEATGGWVAAKWDDVHRVLTDEEHFSPLMSGAGSSVSHGRTILHMSGEEHRRKLAAITHRIRRPAMLQGELGDLIENLTIELLDALPEDEVVDLKATFTTPMPLLVTAKLLGLPEAPQFRSWYDDIVAAGASNLRGDPAVTERGATARVNLVQWLTPIITKRRTHPTDDLLSELCTMEWQGEQLSTDEVVSFCSFILAAGVETTDRALSSLLKYLFTHRETWIRLGANRGLIPAACAEILRWAPPVHGISRGVHAATTMRGMTLEPGQRILVLLASANRDEEHFDDPESFRLTRFTENTRKQFTPKSSILPFGAGTHHCSGSLLALQEMVVAMNHLLDRFTWADFTPSVPDDVGYVLRSPAALPVRLHHRH